MVDKTPIKARYDEMDLLRAFAILMVLCYHSILVYPVNLQEITWCRNLHAYLWAIEMPVFFLISGFCFTYHGTYVSYLWKKCKRILIPHVVFCALDILMRILPTGLVNQTGDVGTLLRELLLFGGTDWFLWTLFLMFAFFPILHLLFQKGMFGKQMVLLFVCVFYVFREFLPGLFLLSTVGQFLPFFFIGYMLRQSGSYETVREKMINPGVIVIAFLLNILCAMVVFRLEAGLPVLWFELPVLDRVAGRIRDGAEILLALSGTIILMKVTDLLLRGPHPAITYLDQNEKPIVRERNNRFVSFLLLCSRYSLQLYLLDGYALVVTRTVMASILGITNPGVLIAGNFLLDTAITLAIAKYILDRVNIFRFFCGLETKKKK